MSDQEPGRGNPFEALRQRLGRSLTSEAGGFVRSQPPGAAATAKEAPPGRRADYLAVKGRLQKRLLDSLDQRALLGSGEEALVQAVREFVDEVLAGEELPLNERERAQLAAELVEEALGVGPLAPLMADPAVTDILVNRHDQVFVERFGKLERTPIRFRDAEHVVRVIERLAARVGRRIDASSPMVDLRLADGTRVNATIPPVSIDGPTLSIRRFGRTRLRRADLVKLGTVSPELLELLELVVRSQRNVLISGGTGAGKSTLLGALAEAIPGAERILTIEDTAELVLDQEHVVRLESRPPNVEGQGRIAPRDLLVNALRMRPDRIIVGEVRGPEALDMLQAMNTGHDGSLCTIHANSPRDAMARLETLVLLAGTELPSRAIREQIASAIEFVVHVRRYEDGVRRVESVAEVTGMEGQAILMQEIFRFERRGLVGGRVEGHFDATGIVPRLVHELRERGVAVPMTLFQRRADASRA